MKIQVSFDRTTKKEFRDVCVQRLKNFVQQIKENQQNKNRANHRIELKPDLFSKKTETQSQKQQLGYVSVSKAACVPAQIVRQSKTLRKQNKTIHQKSNRNAKLNDSHQTQNQQTKNNKKATININMSQIKENLSKIMQKFEKQHQENSIKNMELEQKVQTTNEKLDRLIEELTKKKILCQAQDKCNASQKEVDRNCFMQKFNQLEAKYNAIKHNSLSNSLYRHNPNKSVYSMQQTSDSLTFRRNC